MSFFIEYGNTILYACLMAIISYIGLELKKQIIRWLRLLEEKEVAKTCVKSINRIYKDYTPKQKYEMVLKNIKLILNKRNINLTDFEVKMLIAEVCENIDCEGIIYE